MCLIFVGNQLQPRYRLAVVANRDEFYARPSAAAAFWSDAPCVLAGRDLTAGGTWLGVNRAGHFAAITNYRDAEARDLDAPSRGRLVADFLRGGRGAREYLRELLGHAHRYNGFGLLVADSRELFFYSNRSSESARALTPGLYGLSNHMLDTPWPKVERGKKALSRALAAEQVSVEELFAIMGDRTVAAEADLPSTGVGTPRERELSPMFIETQDYGTRCTSIVLIEAGGAVTFLERTYRPCPAGEETLRFVFSCAAVATKPEGGN